jgi:hypothetical protein
VSRLTYAQQLLHPKWQQLRLRVMDAAGWKCQRCGETEVTLNVHHPEYRRGAMAWEYEPEELQCLCAHCHGDAHGKPVPAGTRSEKRALWELLGGFHLQACMHAAGSPGMKAEDVDALAQRLCAAEGLDYGAMLARLYE